MRVVHTKAAFMEYFEICFLAMFVIKSLLHNYSFSNDKLVFISHSYHTSAIAICSSLLDSVQICCTCLFILGPCRKKQTLYGIHLFSQQKGRQEANAIANRTSVQMWCVSHHLLFIVRNKSGVALLALEMQRRGSGNQVSPCDSTQAQHTMVEQEQDDYDKH